MVKVYVCEVSVARAVTGSERGLKGESQREMYVDYILHLHKR